MRRFLQGFGLGILIAALVMGISYRGRGASAGEDIVEQARELGMVFPSGTEQPNSSTSDDTEVTSDDEGDETSAASGSSANGAGLGGDKDTSDNTSKSTDKPKTTSKNTSKPSSSPEPTADSTPARVGDTVIFTVESGLLSSSVAREMKKAGIIADDTAFDHYLLEQGLGKNVIAGTYELPVGGSYEELAKIITHTR